MDISNGAGTILGKTEILMKWINPFSRKDNGVPPLFYVIKKCLAFLILFYGSQIITEIPVIGVHFAMGLNPFNGEMFDLQTMLIVKYYGYIFFIAITILYCIFIEKRSVKSMGFNGKILGYLKGILVGIVLLTVSIGAVMITGQINFRGVVNNINTPVILLFCGGFIIQGAMEETLCRGFLMTSLSKKVSIPIAVGVSTVAFAYPHFSSLFSGELIYSIVGVLNLILISAIFSLYMINDGNIWVSCAIHSFWNFCLFNVVGLNLSGRDNNLPAVLNFATSGNNIVNGGAYGIESSCITTVVLAICVALLIFKFKRLNVKKTKI